MLFNTLHYFIFLTVLLPIFFLSNEKNQRRILFVFSLYFYSCLKIVFVPILFLSFAATFVSAIKMKEATTQIRKKLWLLHTLFVNLGLLFLFKYADFFRSIEFDVRNLLGLPHLDFEPIGFVLPLGISFYTFQAVAYAIDVYRGNLNPERSFFNFTLFLLFFPQLVAGPIMRAHILMPQLQCQKKFDWTNFQQGIPIMMLGFFKKTIVADPISSVIQPIFANPSEYDWFSCALASSLFSIQIYGDFSGYSDIAIGTGKILGFNITQNFDRPFFSKSASETWRRWHMSLSTWLRDYVYITLGGNRVSRLRNYFNLFTTMAIGGLWHGANWTFIIWGFINAGFVCLEKFLEEEGYAKYFEKIPYVIKILYAFSTFTLSVTFFRAESVSKAIIQLKNIFFLSSGNFNLEVISISIWFPVFLLFTYEALVELKKWDKFANSSWMDYVQPAFFITLFILCVMIYTVISSPQFYYFQF